MDKDGDLLSHLVLKEMWNWKKLFDYMPTTVKDNPMKQHNKLTAKPHKTRDSQETPQRKE